MSKLLLIGPLTDKKDPSKSGGTVVLFELLLKELEEKRIEVDVIDTLKENYANSIFAFISITFQLIKQIKKHEYISLHATANSLIFIGPIMIFLAKLFNKKTSVRKFAGNFHTIYEKSNFLKKMLIHYVLKNSEISFFETKYLVEYFQRFYQEIYWFPNVRKRGCHPNLPRVFQKKFVFISLVRQEKGIDEIVDVIQKLNSSYIIDIYGPIVDKKYTQEYFKKNNISYKGALKANAVSSILNEYSVLLLPTYWSAEGYPGIIVEAFSLGIPVITTKLKGIIEMVDDHKNGLLIDVKNSKQLEEAIRNINEEEYRELSINALESFNNFDSEQQTNLFLQRIGVKCLI